MRRLLALAPLAFLAPACGPDDGVPRDEGSGSPIEAIYVLDFGEVAAGRHAERSAVVRAGKNPVLLTPPEVRAPFSSDLTEVERVEARGEREVVFSFQPTEAGTFEQEVVLRASGANATYRLSGRALPPEPACEPGDRTERFGTVRPRIDVLLVVDDHRSMDAVRGKLLDEARALPGLLDSMGADWRLAATTSGTGACGGGELLGDFRVLSPLSVGASANLAGALGTAVCNGSGHGLEAAVAGVADAGSSFERPEAALALVVISTRDDKSPEAVDVYAQALQRGHASARMLAVVGEDGGRCAVAEPGTRYAAAVSALGGFRRSLCADDWGIASFFTDAPTFGMPTTYPLDGRPEDTDGNGHVSDGEIEVWIDGERVPARNEAASIVWRYERGNDAVVFTPGFVPARGQTLEIRYRNACD